MCLLIHRPAAIGRPASLGVAAQHPQAALVATAGKALGHGAGERALELVRRARDRNDDFSNALPGMTGLRAVGAAIYHSTLYGVLIGALEQCRGTGALDLQRIVNVAAEELRWINGDFPTLYGSDNENYWHLSSPPTCSSTAR
jgi:hypothetical protein